MALLNLDEEILRAEPGPAFASFEASEAWMQIWCDECNVDQCPLILVAGMGWTPKPWVLRDPGAVNKYVCTEFERRNADDPTVVIGGA